ncbi:alpha/beta hydrolase [Agrobacterium fabrum]|uniref:Phospholipase/carboxylesterase n=1 Tax=Agrobacterium fabrum TaxID=1176649 RepID=A0A7Z7FQJ9_9HYPH|nr:alpha/beta hydrolase [Agrobacterium fabrum]MCR6722716.1 alpha/beta hydrolase [Agrobacterium fabrum]UXT56837.1 alpha/beta hydrolase [Agrobacterium fabrum]WCK77084.1 alpha/beta hydrolase [Agrobacterium fabrum]WIE28167.1 alpha/beta hydrolase [Agrobacterium fabrum]WIE44126.1 alpha/beta hydrolase [Agrobacterium fabrum]
MESAGFHYKLDIPAGTPDCAIVLLHGSGRTEDDLISFGRAVFPTGALYAPRGAVAWENGFAFFRRKPDRELDIDDLKHQATRLCHFVAFVFQQTGRRPILVGYSNGAIIAAETICQAHHLSKGAILLRPLSPRKDQSLPNLAGYPVLLLAGASDDRRHPSDAPHLSEQLTSAGADAVLETINTGHGWAEDAADERLSRQWLARLPSRKSELWLFLEQ